eukprot:16445228-Heterocapsa_arctica.AAC.1
MMVLAVPSSSASKTTLNAAFSAINTRAAPLACSKHRVTAASSLCNWICTSLRDRRVDGAWPAGKRAFASSSDTTSVVACCADVERGSCPRRREQVPPKSASWTTVAEGLRQPLSSKHILMMSAHSARSVLRESSSSDALAPGLLPVAT